MLYGVLELRYNEDGKESPPGLPGGYATTPCRGGKTIVFTTANRSYA